MPKIIFNGKSYSSVDEMPSEIRQAYEQVVGILADKNQNGMPDIFERAIGTGNVNVQTASILSNTTQIVVDDKVYSSIDELPPEARQKYEQAMAKVKQVMSGANQDGALDIPASTLPAQSTSSVSQITSKPVVTVNRLMSEPIPSPISDAAPSSGRLLLAAGIVIVILLVALVFMMFALHLL